MAAGYPLKETQRAYTLLLAGTDSADQQWRDKLWLTHEAVNKGAKAFGDWFLTLRAGLCHTLVDMKVTEGKGANAKEREPTEKERRDRRIILALSWLSVESEEGAPETEYIVARAKDTGPGRPGARKTLGALSEILRSRGLDKREIAQWVEDCEHSLSAAIRPDAVWVNRNKVFDDASRKLGYTREDAFHIILSEFFGPPQEYFRIAGEASTDAETQADVAPVVPRRKEQKKKEKKEQKEFRQLARSWLSRTWGAGSKTDRTTISHNLDRILDMGLEAFANKQKDQLICHICSELGIGPQASNKVLAQAVGWATGRKSKGRLALEALPDRLTEAAIARLRTKLKEEIDEKRASSRQPAGNVSWRDMFRAQIETLTGIPWRCGRDLVGEYGAILDQAARAVSKSHSWIKLAESERQKREKDKNKLDIVPQEARQWFDKYCEDRSSELAALEPYRIRPRAVQGWQEVVKAWSQPDCQTADDRIAAARAVQDDPEIDKFGDINLFRRLTEEDAICVWKQNGEPNASILEDYVRATTAIYQMTARKVPAYRHPDPLRHPVFCDFGESRWSIEYAAHNAPTDLAARATTVEKRTAELEKTQSRGRSLQDDPVKWKKAQEKVLRAEVVLARAREQLGRVSDSRTLFMGLWNGREVEEVRLRWRNKRLARDLALCEQGATDCAVVGEVSRNDRLGRAAVAVAQDETVRILGLFDQKHWNGRLQAPRFQLNRIARRVAKHGWDNKARSMLAHLRWFITFSPRLQPQGPWAEFAERRGLNPSPKAWPHDEENKRRGDLSKLILCRLNGLRVLGVDLGHRYGAACAVWQTLSKQEMDEQCQAVGEKNPGPSEMFRRFTNGKKRAIFRRVGADALTDGTPHPAAWARLERQFLIRLQGEKRPPRWATDEERKVMTELEAELGRKAPERRDWHIDEVMSDAVRLVREAIIRHGRRARIAYFLIAESKPTVGGGKQAVTEDDRIDRLAEWYSLASDTRWSDPGARELWEKYIRLALNVEVPRLPGEEEITARQRKEYKDQLRQKLRPIMQNLSMQDRKKLSQLWAQRWKEDDAKWPGYLRLLKRWILPHASRKEDPSIRRVGGLSLTRLATVRALYELHRAYRNRPEPGDLTKNVPKEGESVLVGKRMLETLEQMRENRVKQLASRIAEAALGIGIERKGQKGKTPPRPRDRVKARCHAIIIESLANYRPDQTRTRRENRGLMTWSARKLHDYLADACELYGLHLREISPRYTSRQDSRAAAPGIRCQDFSIVNFVKETGYLSKRIKRAQKEISENKSKNLVEEKYLVDLVKRWNATEKTWQDFDGSLWKLGDDRRWISRNGDKLPYNGRREPRPVRIPIRGGDLFVSADAESPAANGLQADLNAAANIGLKSLLDPDWEGRWWYVPCATMDMGFMPLPNRIKGCKLLEDVPLPTNKREGRPLDHASEGTRKRRKGKRRPGGEVVNLWRDPSSLSADSSDPRARWYSDKDEYWADVKRRVVAILRKRHGMGVET